MTAIAVIDLSNLFWSAWMSQRDADPVSAAHDWTIGKVRRFAEGFGAGRSHVGIACDAKDNWRRAMCPTYKAGRMERGEAAWAQLGHTIDSLRAEGYPIWLVDGYEADDIMATVAAQAPVAGHEVVIITNDKDLRQCIRGAAPAVSVLTPGDRSKEPTRITESNCGMDKRLVPPRLVRDYLALRGDGSDNLPGVNGIGPVKALEFLERYGSFLKLIGVMESEPEAFAAIDSDHARVVAGKASACMTWDLVGLRTDVPVAWSDALAERVATRREPATKMGGGVPHAPRAEAAAVIDAESEDVSREADAPLARVPASTALAAVPVEWRLQCEPTSMDSLWDCAAMLYHSGAFPAHKKQEQMGAAIMLGRVHGIPAAVAAKECFPVKDRMSMSANLIVGICLRAKHVCEYIEWESGDDKSSTWVAKRVGRSEKRLTFTLEQAMRAGYTDTYKGGTMGTDGMYYKDAETMLSARCSTRLARRVFPDIVAGCYSAEELHDVGGE